MPPDQDPKTRPVTHSHKAMIALATALSLEVVQDDNHSLSLRCLARVLPRCSIIPVELVPLRRAAETLVAASDRGARSAALVRLTQAVRRYHQLVAGAHIDAIRKQARKPV